MTVDTISTARALLEIGAQGIEGAEAEVKSLCEELNALVAASRAGKLAVREYVAESQRLRGVIAQLRAGIAGAEAAVKSYGSAQAAAKAMAMQGEAASRSYGREILSAAFALQNLSAASDALVQAPERPTNIVTLLLRQLGVDSGLASLGIDGLLPAMVELARVSGAFDEAAKAAASEIGKLKLQIETLEAEPLALAGDSRELDVARRKLVELESTRRACEFLGGSRSAGEKSSGSTTGGSREGLEVARGDATWDRLEVKENGQPVNQSKRTTQFEATERDRSNVLGEVASARHGAPSIHAYDARDPAQTPRQDAMDGESPLRAEVAEPRREPRPIGEEMHHVTGRSRKELERWSGVKRSGDEPKVIIGQARQDDRTVRDRESSRFADTLRPGVRTLPLENGGISDQALEARVRRAMEQAGLAPDTIDRTLEPTVKKLRESLMQRISAQATEGKNNGGTAARPRLETEKAVEIPARSSDHRPAGVRSDQDYYRSLRAPASKLDDVIPRALLGEQKRLIGELKGIARLLAKPRIQGFARVAPKGAK